jgi:hypothetical protein
MVVAKPIPDYAAVRILMHPLNCARTVQKVIKSSTNGQLNCGKSSHTMHILSIRRIGRMRCTACFVYIQLRKQTGSAGQHKQCAALLTMLGYQH